MVEPCLTGFDENQLYLACQHFASVRGSTGPIATDVSSDYILPPGYAKVSGWPAHAESPLGSPLCMRSALGTT